MLTQLPGSIAKAMMMAAVATSAEVLVLVSDYRKNRALNSSKAVKLYL